MTGVYLRHHSVQKLAFHGKHDDYYKVSVTSLTLIVVVEVQWSSW